MKFSMRDYSMFQGWKELRGEGGTYRFEADGGDWKMFELKKSNNVFVYFGRMHQKKRESNKALYRRARAFNTAHAALCKFC